MGTLLGLVLGIGLLLIVGSFAGAAPEAGSRPVGSRWPRRRGELLREAGLESISPVQLAVMQLLAAVTALLVVLLISGTFAVAVAFGLFAFRGPPALVRRLRNRRVIELRELWPEIVDNLASAVRAGMSLPEALSGLGTRGPEALRPAFLRFAADYRANGRFSECLDRLKTALADPVGDRICESLRMAREVGGTDLGRLLRTLSAFLREDARTRAELETRQGWTVNAARLAVAAPWLVLLLLATQSTTLAAYDTTAGVVLLAIGGGVCFVAYRFMLRIGRLPAERRVLQ
ncbi:MAG: type II secretion system F family protein [Actinomycetota bacterium]|nr:type II secretion system F family protein [Actinomycetota bacterium]